MQVRSLAPLLVSGGMLLMFSVGCSVSTEEGVGEIEEGLTSQIVCQPSRPGVPPLSVPNYSGTYAVADDNCSLRGTSVARGTLVTLGQKADSCQTVSVSGNKTVTRTVCDTRAGCNAYDMCAIAIYDCETYGGGGRGTVQDCIDATKQPGGACFGPRPPGPTTIQTSEPFSASTTVRAITSSFTGIRINDPRFGAVLRCSLSRKP